MGNAAFRRGGIARLQLSYGDGCRFAARLGQGRAIQPGAGARVVALHARHGNLSSIEVDFVRFVAADHVQDSPGRRHRWTRTPRFHRRNRYPLVLETKQGIKPCADDPPSKQTEAIKCRKKTTSKKILVRGNKGLYFSIKNFVLVVCTM